jgi:type VI secretion system secreted protein Hcp
LEQVPEAAGEVALGAADRFFGALAFGALAGDVVLGLGVAAQAGDGAAAQRQRSRRVVAIVYAALAFGSRVCAGWCCRYSKEGVVCMKGLRRAICMIAPALVVGALIPASASAEDYFLRIDGIAGESSNAKYQDAIELESWSVGVNKEAGKPANAQDFHFVKLIGPASPKLFEATAAGTLLGKAKLTGVRGGGEDQFPYLRMCFTGVRLSSFQTGGSRGIGSAPREQISFSYATLVNVYQGQNPATGEGLNPVFGGWDFINKIRFNDPSC